MDSKLLEIKDCTEAGYHPQIWYQGWRVAYLNDTPRFHLENISEMQRHNTSDEVFILLAGSCTLYIGDGAEDVGRVEAIPLVPQRMYNVRRGTWHTHVLDGGARVVVIENADVSPENTDYAPVRLG